MTHILITDLREIRYITGKIESVPLDPEKDTLPFDRGADKHALYVAIRTNYMKETDSLFELKPGIYQVPVEVEVVSVTDCKMQYGFPPAVCGSVNNCDCTVKQVARIVQPKEESQEEIVQAFFIEYNRLMQGGRTQHSAALKLLDKFSLTRKRG